MRFRIPAHFYWWTKGARMQPEMGRLTGGKERGEWAEMRFMARAAEEGLLVSRPFGGTARYDVGVEFRRCHLRVQVKSTVYRKPGGAFSMRVAGAKSQPYAAGDIDFLAAYLIPLEQWYIVPWSELQTQRGPLRTLYLSPQSRQQRWHPFLEAWHLLRGEKRNSR